MSKVMENETESNPTFYQPHPADDVKEYENEFEEKKETNDLFQAEDGTDLRNRKYYNENFYSKTKEIMHKPRWYHYLFRNSSSVNEDLIEGSDSSIKHNFRAEQLINKVHKEQSIRHTNFSIFSLYSEFNNFCYENSKEVQVLLNLRNLCIVETVMTLIICGLGGLAFRFTEGAYESFYKCGVKRVKRDFLDSLWNFSQNMKEDEWKSFARQKLMDFEEQLQEAHEAGVSSYSGIKTWTFINACMYCLTIISTIGYGHISPSTTTGRALTMIYAIVGIPIFLIILADFSKFFTRSMKFFWAFINKIYFTDDHSKIIEEIKKLEATKNVSIIHNSITTINTGEMNELKNHRQFTYSTDTQRRSKKFEELSISNSAIFQIDDEFNLSLSVSLTILISYILIGSVAFDIIEDWSFFESFYFIFITLSTIGFGDYVPQEPLFMMFSIVYMIFGLALTSMCLNVAQVTLTYQFKRTRQKISAALGLQEIESDL